MQMRGELQTTQPHSPAVPELVRGRELRRDVKKNAYGPSTSMSRSQRRNGQRKKNSGKSKPSIPKRENINVDPPQAIVDHKPEPGRELPRSPLKGVKSLFRGSPSSNGETRDVQISHPYTRPATPGPSRKNLEKERNRFQRALDHNDVQHQQSSSAAFGFSGFHIHDQIPVLGPNDSKQEALPAAPREEHNPGRDSDTTKPVNQKQKKTKNRKKSKQSYGTNDRPAGQGQSRQLDQAVPYEGFPTMINAVQKGLVHVTNRPPPIPTIEFELKSYGDFISEKVPSSDKLVGQNIVPEIDRSARDRNAGNDTVEKSQFPRTGGVVRILQNKDRGMDIGCTQTGNQHVQKSVPQVLKAGNQTHRTTGGEHKNARPSSFDRPGRVRSEISIAHESENMVDKQHRKESQGPSPGACSAPIRTLVSSQDVRHNVEGSHDRKTSWKPRRKRFQKQNRK